MTTGCQRWLRLNTHTRTKRGKQKKAKDSGGRTGECAQGGRQDTRLQREAIGRCSTHKHLSVIRSAEECLYSWQTLCRHGGAKPRRRGPTVITVVNKEEHQRRLTSAMMTMRDNDMSCVCVRRGNRHENLCKRAISNFFLSSANA